MDLADGVLLLRDPSLTDHGLPLAAKLIVRELGHRVILNANGIWDTDKIMSDDEWMAFGRMLRERVERTGWL
jgi:hypothetical protein